MSADVDLEHCLRVAKEAMAEAADIQLRYFREGVGVETKEDRSPVTAADRESEKAIRRAVLGAFPEHGFLGEETGTHDPSRATRWIVDPIDGTRGFTRGGSFWGPLIALEHEGEVVLGVMTLPVLGTSYWAARGFGAYRNGERLSLSSIDRLEDATLSLGEMQHLLAPSRSAGMLRLVRTAASTRCFGDLAAPAMLLDGKADVWMEAGVKVWDIAPIKILVEEAGGRFTDLDGIPTIRAGNAVAGNEKLHRFVLSALARDAD